MSSLEKCTMLDCDSVWCLIGCLNQSKGFPLALEISVSYECEQYFASWASLDSNNILHACLSVWQLEDFSSVYLIESLCCALCLIVALSMNKFQMFPELELHFCDTLLHFCVTCVNLQTSAFCTFASLVCTSLHFCVTCLHFTAL